ncbi:MAG: permease-like cell division protein FtsX [Selenomonadales bacterium]|nr:permease-like cell division protein FtsX [Selenomonadales bacterium]
MKIRTIFYLMKEAFVSLKRNALMSFASISTVAISFLILGAFGILGVNMGYMVSALETQVEVTAYMQDEVQAEALTAAEAQIRAVNGVSEVTFVTKAEALERFRERLGEQASMLEALDDQNPLPNSFEIKVSDPEYVKTVAETIGQMQGVESVKYGREIVDKLFQMTKMLRIVGIVLLGFLVFATLFIISNTIRLTVFARRKEIGIMKYVGATNAFIRLPFLLEGMILGLIGSSLAAGALYYAYAALLYEAHQMLAFLYLVPHDPFIFIIGGILIVSGTLIGAIGSAISLSRYMDV